MAKLTLAFKEKKLKIFPLLGPETVVGRDPDCSITIDSLAIHPRHARIYATGEAFCVEPLQTEEPVLLNRKLITEPAPLQDGDQIQVGKHSLLYSSEPAAEGIQVNHAPLPPPVTGWLQIMSGAHLGRTIRLDRAMTRLGKDGMASAMIARRENGYFLSHLEGDESPRVNDESIGESSRRLHEGDRIRIGKLELHFYLDGELPADAESDPMSNVSTTNEQRRFTRIPFDAVAVLSKDGREWTCELVDLSLKGALIQKPADWAGEAGEAFGLTLLLDQDTRIHMEVNVTHMEDQRVGLCCRDIDLDSITHLRRLVELNLGDAAMLERELSALG